MKQAKIVVIVLENVLISWLPSHLLYYKKIITVEFVRKLYSLLENYNS